MKRILAFVLLLCMLAPCAHAQSAYPDGIYRGFYYDGGIEQISIQFEMENGLFTSIVYRGVKYKDGDYMIEDASDAQKATLKQYEQMAAYLIGKGVDAIDALYQPWDIVHDVDAVTSATVQSSKLISALWDGLNRRPFKLVNTSKLPQPETYGDGLYRGSYMEGGKEEVAVEFRLKNNMCFSISPTVRCSIRAWIIYAKRSPKASARSQASSSSWWIICKEKTCPLCTNYTSRAALYRIPMQPRALPYAPPR